MCFILPIMSRATSSLLRLLVCATLATAFVALASSDVYNQEDVDAFRAWIQDQGVPKSKLKVGPSSVHRYGMIAKDNLEAGDESIFSMPLRASMSSYTAQLSDVYGPMMKETPEHFLPKHAPRTLVIWMLLEKHSKDSEWQPFINMFPRTPTNPIVWPREKLEELRGTSVYREVVTDQTDLLAEYNSIMVPLSEMYPEVFPLDVFTFDEYRWGYAILWSHGTRIAVNGKSTIVLMPLVNFFNHDQQANAHGVWDENTKSWNLLLSAPLAAGEELLIKYGPALPNKILFMDYGFVHDKALGDIARLNPDLPDPAEPFSEIIMDVLKDAKLGPSSFTLYQGESPDLIPAFRALALTNNDVAQRELYVKKEFVSVHNDLRAYLLAIATMRRQKHIYDTTLDEDQELLASDDVHVALAAKFRYREKYLIEKGIEAVIGAKATIDDFRKKDIENRRRGAEMDYLTEALANFAWGRPQDD